MRLIEKPQDMTNTDYLLYLYKNKLELDLSWKDIADIMNQYEGVSYSGDKYRKQCKSLTTFLTTEKPQEEENIFDINEEFSIQKEIQRLKDERSQLRYIYRQATREDTLKDLAIECAKIVAKEKPFEFKCTDKICGNKEAILEISDWHYGIEIQSFWNRYSPMICSDRVTTLLDETIKLVHDNGIKKLHVLNLGDLISGRIHSQIRIENREDVISQTIHASELLANFLTYLAKEVEVEYYDCLDNHSRIEPNKKESLRLESLARITTWYLQERFRNSDRVHINYNEYSDDIIMFNVFNWTVAGVHGDLDKLNTAVKNLQTFTHNNIDVICTAHMHHFSCNEENGCTVIANPSLMGMDSFAESKRLYSKPAQTFIIVSARQPVESIHRIILDD